jgi:hypothetical protein
MKTLNQNFVSFKDMKASAPVLLADFFLPGGTAYLSTRQLAPNPGGPEYSGRIIDWSTGASVSGMFEACLSEATVEFASFGTPSLSDLFGQYGPEGSMVDLFLWFEGLAYADREPLGKFVVSSPVEYTEKSVTLRLVSAFMKRDKAVGKIISRADYPGADPDAVGRHENIIYGSVRNVPCPSIVAGAASRLVADITASQVTGIELSMTADEIEFPSAGTLQIEHEKIAYTGISNRVLTGVTRAAYGTTLDSHKKGSLAFEVRSDFTYLAAGHQVKSIGDVYIDGVRVINGITRFPDSGGKAKFVLDGMFTLEKSVSLSVSEGSHEHESPQWTGIGSKTTTSRWTASVNPGWTTDEHAGKALKDSTGSYFLIVGNGQNYLDLTSVEAKPLASGTYEATVVRTVMQTVYQDTFAAKFNAPSAGTETALCDGNMNSICAIMVSSGFVDTTRSIGLSDRGKIVGAKLCSMRGHSVYSGSGRSMIQGGIFGGQYCEGGGSVAGTCRTTLARSTQGAVGWQDISNMTIRSTYVSGASAASCSEHWVEVYYIPYGGGASPAKGVSLSGNSTAELTVGRTVTCDVDGYQDDAIGTFTGTPNALIENPADVIKHLLVNHSGMSVSEAGPSFMTARTALATAVPGGSKFAGVVDRGANVLSIIRRMCLQSKLAFRHDGISASLKFAHTMFSDPDKTIAPGMVSLGSVKAGFTNATDAINRLAVFYDRDNTRPGTSPEDFFASVQSSALFPESGDALSIGRLGERSQASPMLLTFIRDAATASDLRDYYISRWKDVRKRVGLSVFLDNFEIEQGDIVLLNLVGPAWDLRGVPFMVEVAAFRPRNVKGIPAEIQLTAVEVG